ncbi:PH domain-containing protein [Halobacteria archaeon AArc-curdl1]|uniref:PH domain-containing protein n=1 Tax=Natronosalvus hydrolyticus TaxID=2979988 RepID=A0AAP2Z9T9_9EURY|nr:PH domain-containing protein [Halobacteria archaeon AArc-curdl1]
MNTPHHLHPLSAVTIALRGGFIGFTIPFFLVSIASGIFDIGSPAWGLYLGPVGFAIGAGYGIAYYYRFEYELTENTFDVSSGVVSRRSREIPYRRIQNVDVRQGVLARLLNLATVSVETAGGGDTEATLSFVSESEANRLQRDIRRRTADRGDSSIPTGPESGRVAKTTTEVSGLRAGDPLPEPRSAHVGGPRSSEGASDEVSEPSFDDGTPDLLFDLKPRELLLYSFTTLRPAAAAGLFALFFFFSESAIDILLTTARPFGGPAELTEGTTTSYGILGLVSIINGIVVTYAVSVAYTFATYYGFRLGRADEDFVYERGLLQRYSGSIPAEKVQSVTVTDNPVQRAIEYAGLWVETAGYGPDTSGGSKSAVPLARSRRVYTFAENLTNVETPRFTSPPPLARRRYLVRYSIVAAVFVALAFGLSLVSPLERWYLAAIVFGVVPPAAHLKYVHLGYYVGDDHLVIRRGFWRRRTTVIPYYRVQTISNRRSIFQRRLGLTSVVVDTASSRTFAWAAPTIYDIELENGRAVASTARERLQTALSERRANEDEAGFSVDFT